LLEETLHGNSYWISNLEMKLGCCLQLNTR